MTLNLNSSTVGVIFGDGADVPKEEARATPPVAAGLPPYSIFARRKRRSPVRTAGGRGVNAATVPRASAT